MKEILLSYRAQQGRQPFIIFINYKTDNVNISLNDSFKTKWKRGDTVLYDDMLEFLRLGWRITIQE
jgi:hypothetical protein